MQTLPVILNDDSYEISNSAVLSSSWKKQNMEANQLQL